MLNEVLLYYFQTLRFITDHVSVFPNDAALLPSPSENCSLVAVAPKYGIVFAALGTTFKGMKWF